MFAFVLFGLVCGLVLCGLGLVWLMCLICVGLVCFVDAVCFVDLTLIFYLVEVLVWLGLAWFVAWFSRLM